MTTHDDDRTAELLAQTLHEEAAMVDPDPTGLRAIQHRTVSRSPAKRRWVVGSLGTALATAAVITAVVLVGQAGSGGHTPMTGQPTAGGVAQTGTHPGVYDPSADAADQFTMYYVGPQGSVPSPAPRLFAEPHTVTSVDGPADVAAVHEFLTSTPIDPDYTSGWPQGVDVSGITSANGVTTIALDGAAQLAPASSLGDHGGAVAVQALLRTAGLAPGDSARFTYNAHIVQTLLSADVSPEVSAVGDDETRAWISVDNLVEGQTVSSPVTVQVSGNVFEGTVNWQLLDATGSKVDDGFVTTSMGTWTQAPIELGRLNPGIYTIRCLEYSAEDGKASNVDDKTFTVE